MITVKIDESDLLELLMNRVEWQTDDAIEQNLYNVYYSELIDNGCFEGTEFNVKKIVDNDIIDFTICHGIEDIMKEFNEDEKEAKERIVAEYHGWYLVSSCI